MRPASLRTATLGADNFNPRTPCGVRPAVSRYGFREHHTISIHAPRAGCDLSQPSSCQPNSDFNPRTPCGVRRADSSPVTSAPIFQSTHPVRGATSGRRRGQDGRGISIHAPRAGCDKGCASIVSVIVRFQSTHPVRGATTHFIFNASDRKFQSTHPVRGATLATADLSAQMSQFQSTHPVRGATTVGRCNGKVIGISIHAPRAGCDLRGRPDPRAV